MPVLINGRPIHCEKCLGRIFPTDDPSDATHYCINCGSRYNEVNGQLILQGQSVKKWKKRTGLDAKPQGNIGWRGSNVD